jgi:hypothetical protein
MINMETLQLQQTISVQPQIRAKQIFHIFYRKGNHNYFTTKDDILMLVDIYIKESQFGNHVGAVAYWDMVRKEAKKL